MRTLIELLELVKEELSEDTNHKGLCSVIRYMTLSNKITYQERAKLEYCIKVNIPTSYKIYCPYYFSKVDMEIRKKYLEEIIEKIKLVETKYTSTV